MDVKNINMNTNDVGPNRAVQKPVPLSQMKIQVAFFWVMTPCSDVAGYQRFGGPCCLHF